MRRPQRMGRKTAFAAHGALGVLGVLGATGCAAWPPGGAAQHHVSSASLSEQLRWIEEEADRVVEAVGAQADWLTGPETGFASWNGHRLPREYLLETLFPRMCAGGGAVGHTLLAFDVPDHLEAAGRVRNLWESHGWRVSEGPATQREGTQHFRAERGDGATLALDVHPQWLILHIDSSCSGDSTMSDAIRELRRSEAFYRALPLEEPSAEWEKSL